MSAAWVRSSTSVPDPQSGNYCGVTVGAEPDFLRWAEHGDLVAERPDEGLTLDETDCRRRLKDKPVSTVGRKGVKIQPSLSAP